MAIGLAGCGRMGAGMVTNLRESGHAARAYDIMPGRGDDAPLADFANGLTKLISVVRDTDETDALLFDDQALAQTPSLQTIIICSTLPPPYIHSVRTRLPDYITLIDAPMSGAQIKAEAGTLSFMLGGASEQLAPLMPLFNAMGSSTHHMGDLGAGMTAKVLNNMLAASHTVMTRMVLDWADNAGLDEGKLLALIAASSGQNWLASGFNDIEFARDGYGPDNSIGILVKDVAAGLSVVPKGADTILPETLQSALKNMRQRDT